MSFLDSLGSSQFNCRPPSQLHDSDLATLVPTMISGNRSYGIALFADGRSVDWGQGLCGERLPDHRDFSSAIDEATVQQLGAPNDSTAEAREPEPVMTSTINNDISSSSANSIDHAQPLQLPRFLRGAQLRLTSVACGSGHVIAAVGGGGVISWGGAALGSSGELGEQRLRVLGLAGCRAPQCSHCRATANVTSRNHQQRGEVISSSSSSSGNERWGSDERRAMLTPTDLHEKYDVDGSNGRPKSDASLHGRSDETGGLPVGSNQRVWWVLGLRRKICLAVAAGESYSAALCLEDGSDGCSDVRRNSDQNSSASSSSCSGGGGSEISSNSSGGSRSARRDHCRKQTSLWTWGNGECGQLGLGLTVVKSTAAAQAANSLEASRLRCAPSTEENNRSESATSSSSGNGGSRGSSSTSSSQRPLQGASQQALDGAGGSAQRAWAAAPSSYTMSCAPQRVAFPVGNDTDSNNDTCHDIVGAKSLERNGSGINGAGSSVGNDDDKSDDSDPDEALASGIDEPQPVSISCGPFHAACVDHRGYLYTWGSGTRGQLGHGTCTDVWAPQLVQSLLGVGHLRKDGTSGGVAVPSGETPGLATIVCGLWHTAAVSDSGDLYTWGWGRFGQLGYSSVEEEEDRDVDGEWGHDNNTATEEDENSGGVVDDDDDGDIIVDENGAAATASNRGRTRLYEGVQQDQRRVRQRTRAGSSSSSTATREGDGSLGWSASCDNLVQRWPRLVKALEEPVVGVAAGSRHTVALSRADLLVPHSSGIATQSLHVFGSLGPRIDVEEFNYSTINSDRGLPSGNSSQTAVVPGSSSSASVAAARDDFLGGTTAAATNAAASAKYSSASASVVQDQITNSTSLTWSAVTGVLTDGTARTPALPPGHTQVSAQHVAVAHPVKKGPVTALSGGPWHVLWGAGIAGTPPGSSRS